MKYLIAVAIAAAALVMPATAYADEKPPGNDTGCCFSFDDSPVNVIFCTVPGACVIAPPR